MFPAVTSINALSGVSGKSNNIATPRAFDTLAAATSPATAAARA